MDKSKIILAVVSIITAAGVFKVANQTKSTSLVAEKNEIQIAFNNYLIQHGKFYSPEEREYRFGVFTQSFNEVKAQNARNGTWKAALNKFSDMTVEERSAKLSIIYTEDMGPREKDLKFEEKFGGATPPDSINWVTNGKVTSVKDEGNQCAAGYAFGTVEPLESAFAIESGELQSLSAQQIIDCTGSYGNKGCKVNSIFFHFLKFLNTPL
jgi:cathepsin L